MAKIHRSPFSIDVPVQDVVSWVFSSGDARTRSEPQFFDADQPSSNFSLAAAEKLVRRLGKGLQDLGLQEDDKVLLFSGNSLYVPVVVWATIASGCVFTGCSPGASVGELAYQLQDGDVKLMLAGPGCAEKALKAADQVGLPRTRVFEFCPPAVTSTSALQNRPWTALWVPEAEAESWSWRKFNSVEAAASTTAVINYSSGTTGLPKGVEISHHNLVSNSEQVLFKRNMVGDDAASKARRARLDSSEERWLAPLPMFHAYGQAYYCMSAARCGAKIFIMPQYDIQKWMTYLDVYRITFLTGIPTLIASLAKHPKAAVFNFNAIETVVTGSAPLNRDIGALVEKKLLKPGVQVKQGWGMTETTCSATGFAPDDRDDGRSVGWLNPNIIAKIVPVPDRDFSSGTSLPYPVGEIWVSGPNIAMGYYKKPEATAETFVNDSKGRWLRTGDIGYFDDRGCMYIIDRMKELIKVKGLQVAPAEIEQTLLLHDGVADCAVIALKTATGEFPKAFVVKKQGGRVLARDLEKFIEDRLAKHKWLTAGVEFIKTIPRTPSGKIIRRDLQPKPETKL